MNEIYFKLFHSTNSATIGTFPGDRATVGGMKATGKRAQWPSIAQSNRVQHAASAHNFQVFLEKVKIYHLSKLAKT